MIFIYMYQMQCPIYYQACSSQFGVDAVDSGTDVEVEVPVADVNTETASTAGDQTTEGEGISFDQPEAKGKRMAVCSVHLSTLFE